MVVDEPGWCPVLDADAVPPGGTAAVDVDDRELVAWRGHDGDWCVMDARCPHQWSHLAAEGVVDGDELVCVAHFWRFDRMGRGTKLNVKGRRDPKADVDVVPCRVRAGRVEIRLDRG